MSRPIELFAYALRRKGNPNTAEAPEQPLERMIVELLRMRNARLFLVDIVLELRNSGARPEDVAAAVANLVSASRLRGPLGNSDRYELEESPAPRPRASRRRAGRRRMLRN